MNQKIPCSFCGSKRGKPSHWTKGKEFFVYEGKKHSAEPLRVAWVLIEDVYVCKRCQYDLFLNSNHIEAFEKSIFFRFFERKGQHP